MSNHHAFIYADSDDVNHIVEIPARNDTCDVEFSTEDVNALHRALLEIYADNKNHINRALKLCISFEGQHIIDISECKNTEDIREVLKSALAKYNTDRKILPLKCEPNSTGTYRAIVCHIKHNGDIQYIVTNDWHPDIKSWTLGTYFTDIEDAVDAFRGVA